MQIIQKNNGSLRELMDGALHDLRNANERNYLSAEIRGGSKGLKVQTANHRGFVIALDYSTNPTGGYMSPTLDNGTTTAPTANLTKTYAPKLDRMTANYQYVQFGHEIDNENLANSKSELHVGPGARALAVRKELERRLEFEEWYFCRGDGYQTLAEVTGAATLAVGTAVTVPTAGTNDGAGSWMLRVGQRVRVVARVALGASPVTAKAVAIVTAKADNKSVVLTAESGAALVLAAGDLILPESDKTAPSTVGIKGLPYIVNDSGPYFDKDRDATPALKSIVDKTATSISRTATEILHRRHKSIRNNGRINTVICVAPARMSDYYQKFYTDSNTQVHVMGSPRPLVDIGAASEEYTFWGQAIREYKMLHPKFWFNLDIGSLYRLTLKEAGAMLTPAGEYVQKIAGGEYVNAQVRWSDDYLEYLSPNPALNSCFNNLTFTGLPLLSEDPYTGS